MGFLDKAKDLAKQAETSLNSATANVGASQQTKVADTWLKELGQWVYADRMGRDPRAAAEIEVRIGQLQQWEQQNATQVPLPVATPTTSVPGAPQPIPGSAPIPSAEPVASPPPPAPPAPPVASPPPPSPPAPPAPPSGPPPDLPGPPSGPPPGLPGPPV